MFSFKNIGSYKAHVSDENSQLNNDKNWEQSNEYDENLFLENEQ